MKNPMISQRLLHQVATQLDRVARWRRPSQRKNSRKVRRVVHVSPAYFSDESLIGGGERYATYLAQATAQHLDATLVSFGSQRQSLKQGNLKIEVYPTLATLNGLSYDPLSYSFLKELLKADVVHCHQYRLAVTNLAILAGAALGKRVFVSDYGGVGVHFTEELSVEQHVDGFLPISNFSANLLPAYKNRQVLYGGVPHRFIEHPINKADRPNILFVGRLLPHKGINYLIEAIEGDVSLEIIGRPYHEEYFKLLQQLAVGKNVRFITNASDDDLFQAYRRARVSILPSVYVDVYGNQYPMPELLGLVLLEGMASGAAVICTDVGSMPEIVQDGITGFVVPPNDPQSLRERINYLWHNPEVTAQMGQAGRQKVLTDFTWEAVAQRCLAAYTQFN